MKKNPISTLVKMQLREKMDLSFLKDRKKTTNKIVFSILLFIGVVAFSYLLLYVAKRFNIFSLVNFVPISVLTTIFSLMLILSIISCTYGLMKTLYFSKDNIVLLTFPVTANQVFVSKLIVFYIYELKKTASFLLPLFLAYGLINLFGAGYYLWLLLTFAFIAALPVLIGAVLSIPTMMVAQFIKKRKYLEIPLFLMFLIGAFLLLLRLIYLIPANINLIGAWGATFWRIQDLLQAVTIHLSPFHYLTKMIVGNIVNFKQVLFSGQTFAIFGSFVGILLITFGLAFGLSRPLFFKMASKPFEHKSKTVKKPKTNKQSNKFSASVKKEFLINFRTPELIYSNFATFATLPISIYLLNKIYMAMNMGLRGLFMTFSFNILLTLLILLSSNVMIASAFSKEGASGYLIKTKPASYHISLISKLIFNLVLASLFLVITTIILGLVTTMTPVMLALFFFTVLLVYVGHMVWSAELDIMNPQNQQYSTTGEHSSNPNQNKSTIFSFLLAFLFFAVSLFLFPEGLIGTWLKLFLLAFAFAAFRIYLFYFKIKLYYREV